EHRKAIEYFNEARAVIEKLNRPEDLGQILSYIAGAYQHMGEFLESIRVAQYCVDYGESMRDPFVIGIGHEFLAEDYSSIGEWKKARENSLKNRGIGARIGPVRRPAR